MTNTILKSSSDYQTFLDKRNIFGLADKSRIGEMEKDINNYLDYVAKKFPLDSVPEKLEELKNKNQDKLKQAISNLDRQRIREVLIAIFKDRDLVKLLKSQAQKQIDELFKKTASLNFNQVDEEIISSFKGKIRRGLSYSADEVVFLTHFLGEEVFLNHIPAELQKELEKDPRTNFSRVDQNKWNNYRNNLLSRMFYSFPSTLTKEEDLAEIEKAINEIYPQFLELIKEAKQSQNGKPDELTGQTGGSSQGGNSSQNLAELEQVIQNALTTNPQTGTNWDPILTEEEKEIIKDPSLDTKGAIQAAAKLLSHLRDIRNDEKNGGPDGKLTDWDAVEKVNGAISTFQKNHYDNILPYQQASANSDQGKAWKATNSKLNNVAENVYNRYWSLICNISKHQVLEKQVGEFQNQVEQLKKLKARVLEVITKVNQYWNKTEIIDRKDEEAVLGSEWQKKLLENSTLEEVDAAGDKLIENINKKKKAEEEKQKKLEEEIQTVINNVQTFLRRFNLTEEKSKELLEKLEKFQKEWGTSSNPAEYRAFLSKDTNQETNRRGVLVDLIQNLGVRIRGEKAIQLINGELRDLDQEESKRYPLQSAHLEEKYKKFVAEIRKMNDEEAINKYENGMIISISKLRPLRVDLDRRLESVKKLLDKEDNSLEAQQNREKIWDFLFDLEKYKNSSESDNKSIWLTYRRQWTAVDSSIDKLLELIRDQDLNRLTSWKNLLISMQPQGKDAINKAFNEYQQSINRANSQDLKHQIHEKAFREKIKEYLEQQSQLQREQISQTQIQQNIPPKK